MFRALAIVLFALSAFFVFYTVRLLAVTRGLAHARPLLAVVFAWAGVRSWARGKSGGPGA